MGCALKHPTFKVMPLLSCTKSNCWSNEPMMNQTLPVVTKATPPDCSKMACPKVCQCTEDKCSSQVETCLGDSTCASLQSCVQQCNCGDHMCTMGCALKHPTTKV